MKNNKKTSKNNCERLSLRDTFPSLGDNQFHSCFLNLVNVNVDIINNNVYNDIGGNIYEN